MDKAELELAAEKEFPLPDKKDYEGAGEAYLIEKKIIEEMREIYVRGGVYVLENIKPL